MDIAKISNLANIGTFLLTVPMLGIMVWQIVYSAPVSPTSPVQNRSQASIQGSNNSRRTSMTPWIMPSVLTLAILVSAFLHYQAHASQPASSTVPTAKKTIVAAEEHPAFVIETDRFQQSGKLSLLSRQASSLASRIQNMVEIAQLRLDQVPGEMQFPLSDLIFKTEFPHWLWYHREVWRVQEDIKTHKVEVRSIASGLHSSLLFASFPNDLNYEQVLAMLESHSETLTSEAKNLLS